MAVLVRWSGGVCRVDGHWLDWKGARSASTEWTMRDDARRSCLPRSSELQRYCSGLMVAKDGVIAARAWWGWSAGVPFAGVHGWKCRDESALMRLLMCTGGSAEMSCDDAALGEG